MKPNFTRLLAVDEKSVFGISVAAVPATAVVLIKFRLFIFLDMVFSSYFKLFIFIRTDKM